MCEVNTLPPIRAITLDLDDTLWPFPPIGERIERVLHAWFEQHAPRTAAQFPIPAMRRLRERVIERYPQQSHDASWLRRKGIEIALAESGSDPTLADAAYSAFFAERNRVDFYDDAADALARIAARCPTATRIWRPSASTNISPTRSLRANLAAVNLTHLSSAMRASNSALRQQRFCTWAMMWKPTSSARIVQA